MSEKYDGGPAFPSHGTMGEVVCSGMTLRDYFAGQALAGSGVLIQLQADTGEYFVPNAELAARKAYAMADAMLKARDE